MENKKAISKPDDKIKTIDMYRFTKYLMLMGKLNNADHEKIKRLYKSFS